MGAYIPVAVWLVSGFICAFIARKRGVKTTLFWTLLVAFLGPFAIPLMFLARPANPGPGQ